MAKKVVESTLQGSGAPYPPSWIDRLIEWIDDLPGPTWVFYALVFLIDAVTNNAMFWIDGSMPVGSFDPISTIFAFFVAYWPALYQYLTRVGSRALQAFRPLLEEDDPEIARIDYELATLPRRLGRLAIPLGFGLAIVTILGDPAPYGDIVPQTALPYVGDIAITGLMGSTFFCLLIRSIRQLRMVSRLHARATKINLLELRPAHAFSGLTARTGAGVILVLIVGYVSDPLTSASAIDLLLSVATALLSLAVFVVPIIGIRDRIEEEKERALHETNDLLRAASDRLHNRVRSDNYQGMGDTNDAIEALIRERGLIEKISTWPWDPRTLRGFASALLLPIFLWLVTRLLERLF